MKNVKLAVKIGGGFGVVILVFLVLGVFNGWYMLDIKDGAQRLNEEYIPEVRILDDFKTNFAEARIALGKYIFSFDNEYYEKGMQSLQDARVHLNKAGELADKYVDLKALKKQQEVIDNNLQLYRESNERISKMADKAVELNKKMDDSAGQIVQNVTQFLDMQKEQLQRQTGLSDIRQRVDKIYRINNVLDMANSIRVANFKAEARNNHDFARQAMPVFDKIDTQLARIEKEIRRQENLDQLQAIHEALDEYKAAMQGMLDIKTGVEKELEKAASIGASLLDQSTAVAQKGMERMVTVGKENVNNVNTAILVFAVGLVLTLILGGGIAVLLTLSITRPIFKGVDFAKKMADGDYSSELDIDQKDEVGSLARALNEMVKSNAGMFKEINNGVDTLASSSTELNSISDDMSSRSESTASKANTVATAAEEMSTNMNSVAAAMEQAATNVSTVATASEEMSSTISEIAENSEKAKNITGDAVQKSQETSNRVNELGKAASEISKVTESITAISSQTNLLALNATIEAARAGEAGKGFAVVANEIKELAQQTASATDEIKERIQAIQDATGMTVSEIEEISQVINDIDSIISTIAAAVEEQSATTRDIAENVGQASSGIQEVNENVAQSSSVAGEIAQDIADVNSSATEMSNSSAQVSQSSEELSQLAEKLKNLVARFKV